MVLNKGNKKFPETRWSLIEKIRSSGKEESDQALGEICRDYWAPLYNFLRMQGDSQEDAEDYVQGFFLQMLSKDSFAMITPPLSPALKLNESSETTSGTLRSYLLSSLKHYRRNVYRNRSALKRGGTELAISIDHDYADKQFDDLKELGLNPDECFDRAWALNLIAHVTNRLKSHYEERGKLDFFLNFEPLLAWNENSGHETYADIARRLDVSQQAVKNGVHRIRRKLREAIKTEIARTIDEKAGVTVEGELNALYSILS